MPKEDFKKAVEKEPMGWETEPWEAGQRPLRGYCLEMIRPDFLGQPT